MRKSMKSSSSPPFRMKVESRVIDLKEKYAPHERPEFTTSKKMTKRRTRPVVVDTAVADNYEKSNGRSVSAPKPQLESRRENIARSYTYESILYDQIVSLESLLIIAKAASTGHDIDEVLSCVGSRARETVDDDLKRYEGQLEVSQGQSETNRVAAFDHISTKLCGRVESFLYNEKEQKVLQEKRKEEEKKSAEHKQKETSQAIQIADYEIKLQELITGYDKLQSDFNIAEKKIESLKIVLNDTIAENVPIQQLLVEMRIQGLDFKSEVDRRCGQVLSVIEAQLGYLPGAVERQLLVLLNLLPPGDPKYDTARILGDPRSVNKLRIIDGQNELNLGVDQWYKAVSNSKNKIENKEMNKDKNKNEKIMTNIDKNKIKSNSLSSPLSRSATKRMNNQTEDKLLAHALEPNSQYENKIKIEKLLKSSTIEEKKIKKKHLIDYGERKIIQIVGGKKKKCDFPANFITENSTSKKNTRINSKPCSKKNRNSQISFESSIGPENVLFNGKDTSYVEFLSSVNLIRENIVRGTKAARTEIHPRTDTIENIELHGEVSEGEGESEGEGGVEERKSDNDSDSLSPNTHNMRNFDYSDVDINKSGISDPECLNNSIRDVLINSYNASLHDSMIDTYDVFNTVRTAEYLKYRSNETGVTVSYSVPSISTSTSIPVHMTATSHSHNLRNQNIAIGEYEEEQEGGIVEREKEKGSAGVRTQSQSVIGAYEKSESIQTLAPAHTSATLTKTRTQTETGMGTGIGMETVTGMGTVTVTGTGIETGRGRGMGVDEGFMKAERSSEDWIAWARRGARLPLSDSVNTIINTNNLTSTSTSTSMQNKSEKEFQDPGSEVGIKGNVFYHEDFLPVFSTKVIESSRNINRIEYDNVSGGKIQGTINNNYNDNNDTNDDKINEKNEKREQINKISVNNNNDNNHYYDNNKKIDKKNDEVENNRHKEVENEDEDDLLVYDMPQYYDDYYEYNRVLDNNKTYYSDPITVNDNDTTQSYNAKEYNEEDTQFKTKTEMNIYTELDETDPYTVSSEPYNFVHGIRKTENSSVSYAKDYEDGDEFYRVVDKVRGKVKVGKHTDKEDSYSSNKGIAFPLRGTRTDSRIKIKNTESSDLSDYHGPSAAILESYMKDIYEQSSN